MNSSFFFFGAKINYTREKKRKMEEVTISGVLNVLSKAKIVLNSLAVCLFPSNIENNFHCLKNSKEKEKKELTELENVESTNKKGNPAVCMSEECKKKIQEVLFPK